MATILLVEDEETPARLLARFLTAEGGYEVVIARDGAQAVALAQSGRPALILMDWWLKGSALDAREATRQLKAAMETKHIPIIAVTAFGRDKQREALEAGCDGFHPKPVNQDLLLEQIQEQLHRETPP